MIIRSTTTAMEVMAKLAGINCKGRRNDHKDKGNDDKGRGNNRKDRGDGHKDKEKRPQGELPPRNNRKWNDDKGNNCKENYRKGSDCEENNCMETDCMRNVRMENRVIVMVQSQLNTKQL